MWDTAESRPRRFSLPPALTLPCRASPPRRTTGSLKTIYLKRRKHKQARFIWWAPGPGDPDLLTLKALQLMQKADVILYDNLVSTAVLERARRDAAREFVGKRSGYKSTSQEGHQRSPGAPGKGKGKRVLRLKGGDPFISAGAARKSSGWWQKKIPLSGGARYHRRNGLCGLCGHNRSPIVTSRSV